jgi:hypothetical protein
MHMTTTTTDPTPADLADLRALIAQACAEAEAAAYEPKPLREVEQAVKMSGHKKFHRLQPNALIGTVRCGAGFRHDATTPYRWLPVADVLTSQRCQTCWNKAEQA